MHFPKTSMLLVLALFIESASRADAALTVPFTENFTSGNSNWQNNISTAPTFVAGGGIDGAADGYLSWTKGLTTSIQGQTVFRAHDYLNSSGNNFFGDWVAGEVKTFSFYIRHNNAAPLAIGARFAIPDNFPAFAIQEEGILPNVWTRMSFDIDPSNPDFQAEAEGITFNDVFSNIGALQIAAGAPGVGGSNITFDFDKVSILPAIAVLLGDVNNDQIVNQLDLNVVFGNWLATGANLAQGDANNDGVINQLDINTITGNWLATGSAGGILTTAVPEPSSSILVSCAALALAAARVTRQRS